jgi:hypothetical protein
MISGAHYIVDAGFLDSDLPAVRSDTPASLRDGAIPVRAKVRAISAWQRAQTLLSTYVLGGEVCAHSAHRRSRAAVKGRIRMERLKNIKFAVHIIRELILRCHG